MPTFSMLTFVFAGLAAFACATASKPPVQQPDSEPIVAELRAQNGVYVRRIADLEDRVLFLENELARARGAAPVPPWAGSAGHVDASVTSRVRSEANSGRAAATVLDTRGESSSLAAGVPAVPGGIASDVSDSTVVGVHDVEYDGDAALRSKARRPVLRLRPAKRDESSAKRR